MFVTRKRYQRETGWTDAAVSRLADRQRADARELESKLNAILEYLDLGIVRTPRPATWTIYNKGDNDGT